MDEGDRGGAAGAAAGGGEAEAASSTEPSAGVDGPGEQSPHPRQSPLYYAHHADRYQRQGLIEAYEERTGAKLVAVIDYIDLDFVQNVEELLIGDDKSRELHVLLRSPGGDGEQAIRAARAMQARCSRLVLIVPDMAKSAATLLALGADEIRVGPTSDLGPIDPQMMIGGRWFAAKSVVSAVAQAEQAVKGDRAVTPLWASLLAEVTALDHQEAKSELDRTKLMVKQALGYRSSPPSDDELEALSTALVEKLQDTPHSHATTFGARELDDMGLPIVEMDPCGWEWECVWRLWTLYWVQVGGPIYESRRSSYRPVGPQPA